MKYEIPNGVHEIPTDQLDLRTDAQIDQDLLHPAPVEDEKNIWIFWTGGFEKLHPYTKRNVRTWHRRFSKQGWVVRVLDTVPGSSLNVGQYLDTSDPTTFPKAFRDGTIGGTYGAQHTSDLVRFPLLVKYGGVYADVGLIQIGDLDHLWRETIGNPDSPYEIITYNMGGTELQGLANYFLCSNRNNALFQRCHKLFVALWDADGGKTSTEGMHEDPLIRDVPLLAAQDKTLSFEENGKTYGPQEVQRMLSDYIVQGQAMNLVMGLVDAEDGWNGPEYVAKHLYAIDYMWGSQLINEHTSWNGPRAFELMSLPLPSEPGPPESEDQVLARKIVEDCLQRSFGFKLAHGLILRVMGDTLGSLWRKHEGSDDVAGTYAHWFRYGTVHWCQDKSPPRQIFDSIPTYKIGPLLKEH
jgi:hypothetical protein